MIKYKDKKTLVEFLGVLDILTHQNIDFINKVEPLSVEPSLSDLIAHLKYNFELTKIQALINSFEFEEDKKNNGSKN